VRLIILVLVIMVVPIAREPLRSYILLVLGDVDVHLLHLHLLRHRDLRLHLAQLIHIDHHSLNPVLIYHLWSRLPRPVVVASSILLLDLLLLIDMVKVRSLVKSYFGLLLVAISQVLTHTTVALSIDLALARSSTHLCSA
jgi:hypothetical protein